MPSEAICPSMSTIHCSMSSTALINCCCSPASFSFCPLSCVLHASQGMSYYCYYYLLLHCKPLSITCQGTVTCWRVGGENMNVAKCRVPKPSSILWGEGLEYTFEWLLCVKVYMVK